jgi:hypothetical protein
MKIEIAVTNQVIRIRPAGTGKTQIYIACSGVVASKPEWIEFPIDVILWPRKLFVYIVTIVTQTIWFSLHNGKLKISASDVRLIEALSIVECPFEIEYVI